MTRYDGTPVGTPGKFDFAAIDRVAGPRLDCENLGREIRDTEVRVEILREGIVPARPPVSTRRDRSLRGRERRASEPVPAVAGDVSKRSGFLPGSVGRR